ncbi:uncharacterized protein N7473_011519 [Penicillium subrubescens]|nr:uncharacterized protein N7473_011519 [Penicillium subrubescens]KAJ5880466.1 hypothetical protein N7473_011519 [Penicillium subrubescens]
MALKKSTAMAGTKRKLNEITAEQTTQEQVEEPSQQVQPSISTSTPPQTDLPSDLNLESPYEILIHFIGEEIFQRISRSTNEYVAQQDQSSSSYTSRTWKDTTIDDIKVFFGLLIYMSVHIAPSLSYYFNTDWHPGPLHPSRHYMGQKHFEQIKRNLRIPLPLPGQVQRGNQSSTLSFDGAAPDNDEPGASFAKALLARGPWDKSLEEELDSPEAIHDFIGRHCAEPGLINRNRSAFKIFGNPRKFPAPLPFPFLEDALMKAWQIQRTHKKQQGVKASKLPTTLDFREDLSREFFAFAGRPQPPPKN